jgi:hypothetical protein
MGISKTLDLPVLDIQAFYRQRSASSRFIRSIERAGRSFFSDEDMISAAAALPENDPILKRTLELAAQAFRTGDGLARRAILGWIKHLIRAETAALMPLPEQDQTSARGYFEAIVTRLKDSITNSEPKGRDDVASSSSKGRSSKAKKQAALRLVALTQLVFLWLCEERNLSPSDAQVGFEMILGKARRVKTLPARKAVILSMARAERTPLEAVLSAFKYLEQDIISNTHALLEAQAETARANAAIEQATNNLQAARDQLERLQGQLATAQTDIARLQRDNETRAEGHRHALRDLRGRSLGFVRTKLKPLIDQALDALEGDPPFADIALHRLQSIKARVAEEDIWLARLD